MPSLSVVVPAYNEEVRLRVSLPAVLDYLESAGRSFEVVVVDDGSADATRGVAEAFAARGVRAVQLAA